MRYVDNNFVSLNSQATMHGWASCTFAELEE